MNPLAEPSDWALAALSLSAFTLLLLDLVAPHRVAAILDRIAALADTCRLPGLSQRITATADQLAPAEPDTD